VAADDGRTPAADDEELPPPKKLDVRGGSHDDMGVHINRDLRGQGSTARGWNSNMSQLNFSSRGRPRDEIAAEEPVPVRVPASSAPSVTPKSPAAPVPPASRGVRSWLTGLFSRR
jgi:hypothetical protein